MRCVILAGGLATRMRPATETIPKSLLKVNGEPFVHHQLSLLAREGVSEVVFCIGYLGSAIRDFVGDGERWGVRVAYVDEGAKLRGTGGALRLAVDESTIKGRFFTLYGDSYLPVSYRPVWAAAEGAETLMTVHENEGRWDSSNVIFKDGLVTLYEKGRTDARSVGMRYIDYGLLVLTEDFVRSEIPADKVLDLAEPLHRLSLAGRLRGYEVKERFYEIGSPQGLKELEKYLNHPLENLTNADRVGTRGNHEAE